MSDPEPVHRWGSTTKRTVVLVALVLCALVLYRFREVIPPLIIALLVAFVLDPVVDFLAARVRLARGLATGVVFFVLFLVGLGAMAAPVTAFPSIQRAVRAVQFDFTHIITDIGAFLGRPLQIWGYSLDLSNVYQELNAALSRFATSVAQGTLNFALTVASGAFWLVFILIASFYLVKDADRIVEQLDRLAPPGYRDDFVRLRRQVTAVWHAFLRGQLLLGLTIAVMITIAGTAVGLPYAAVLGLFAGVVEFVPNLGPFLAAIPAVLMALFQGSSFLPLSNFWFAVLVVGLYIIVQQIEGNLLVPRILGHSLDLHPLVVLIAIIVGGILAGILGMLVAAPVLATLRVVGRYVFYRLYDRDPFAEPAEETAPPKPGLLKRVGKAALCRLRKKINRKAKETGSTGGGKEQGHSSGASQVS
jgi:predicted PurR-regulated permease PerM